MMSSAINKDNLLLKGKTKSNLYVYFNFLAKYSVILPIVPSLFFAFFPGKIMVVTIICSYPIVFGLIHYYKKINFDNLDAQWFLKAFFFYGIIVLIRGVFDAHTNLDYTSLLYIGMTLSVFLPLSIQFAGFNATIKTVVITFFKIGIFLAAILYFMPLNSGPFGFNTNMNPILFMLILSPFLREKIRYLIYCIVIVSFFNDFSNRAFLINTIIALLILVTYVFRKKKAMLLFLKIVRYVLFIIPIAAFILGITGIFNIFKIGDYLPEISLTETKKDATQDVFVDSRTAIYIDVLQQLKTDNAFLFGFGGVGKTKTSLSDAQNADYDIIYKEGRRDTESSMLNYIQKGGILGGSLYFLLLFQASYYGLCKSKNWFCVMLGVWVAYKFLFSFIEDPMSFSVSSMFLFFSIGLCLNKNFRAMTDKEITKFFEFRILNLK
jgi:hypothetical protein